MNIWNCVLAPDLIVLIVLVIPNCFKWNFQIKPIVLFLFSLVHHTINASPMCIPDKNMRYTLTQLAGKRAGKGQTTCNTFDLGSFMRNYPV